MKRLIGFALVVSMTFSTTSCLLFHALFIIPPAPPGTGLYDLGEIHITDIALSESSMVVKVERKGQAVSDLRSYITIRHVDVPDIYLYFSNSLSDTLKGDEEWKNEDESTITLTLDMTPINITAYKEHEEPLSDEQRHSTLYVNEMATLYLRFSRYGDVQAEIFADFIIEDGKVRILEQRVYKPVYPFESIDEYIQYQIRMRQNAGTEETP
jgi:hypothetical protein